MSISVEEKRRFIRFRLLAHGTVSLENGDTFSGTLRDISIGGAFIDISGFPVERQNEEVATHIEVSIDGQKHIIDAHAKVARVAIDGVGLFFNDMDKQSKATFSQIMKKIRERLQS